MGKSQRRKFVVLTPLGRIEGHVPAEVPAHPLGGTVAFEPPLEKDRPLPGIGR